MRILRALNDVFFRSSTHQNWPWDRKLTQSCPCLRWILGFRTDVRQMRLHVYTSSYSSDRYSVCGKRPLAIAVMNMVLPPFKNGEHNSKSTSIIDHFITPLSRPTITSDRNHLRPLWQGGNYLLSAEDSLVCGWLAKFGYTWKSMTEALAWVHYQSR